MKCHESCNCIVFHQETLDQVKKTLYADNIFFQMSDILKIISDPRRLKILFAIEHESLCVCDLAHLVGITKSGVSHQMKLLKKYHLVESSKDKKMVYYKMIEPKILNLIRQILEVSINEKNN